MRGRRSVSMWIGMMVAGAALACPRLAVAQEGSAAKAGVDAQTAFTKLKTLVGEWTGQTAHEQQAAANKEGNDHHDGAVTVTYRLTGAGSALVETQFPGTGHEMVSVYHLDGADLRMTHYCAIGNQPRVKLDRANSTPDHLIFVFDGGTNLNPEKDNHIHGVEITFQKDGRVNSAWEGYAGGKKAGTTSFLMNRK
jgi:hypothetical protein